MGIKGGTTIPEGDLGVSGSSAGRGDAASGGSGGTGSGSGSAGFGSTTAAGAGSVADRSRGRSTGVTGGVGVSAALSDSMCCRLTDSARRISASSSGVGGDRRSRAVRRPVPGDGDDWPPGAGASTRSVAPGVGLAAGPPCDAPAGTTGPRIRRGLGGWSRRYRRRPSCCGSRIRRRGFAVVPGPGASPRQPSRRLRDAARRPERARAAGRPTFAGSTTARSRRRRTWPRRPAPRWPGGLAGSGDRAAFGRSS